MPALGNRTNVQQLFNECQKSVASHQKHTIAFRRLYREQPTQTLADLKACIKAILVQFKREPAVERCVKYVVRLTTHVGEGDEAPLEDAFAMDLLEWLLSNSCAKDKAVRYRVCQLVQCIMNALSDDAEISDVLWDTLQDSMLDRVRDKVPLVRAHAVAALERLQDPSDKEDPVCTEYIRILQADASNVVRKAVITHVGISKYTLRHVLARARDVKEDVRAHLYSSLGNKLEMRVLSIKQRIQLLSDGLKDRSAMVRDACMDLLKAWHKQAGDSVAFLRCMDVENSDEEKVEAITTALFQCNVESGKPEVKDEMSPEEAFYWRMWLTDMHARDKDSAAFESAAPTLTEVCDRILSGHSDAEVARYNRRQFLLMTQILDFSDEAGRRRLLQLVRQLATSIEASTELVNTAMKVIVKLHEGQDSEMCTLSMELVNDVLDPMEQGAENCDKAQIHSKIAELEDEKQKLLTQEKYAELAEVDSELKSLKAMDEQRELRWIRCLAIAEELLQHIGKANASLVGLTETAVFPGIQHPNSVIRGAAVRVLSLLCLLDRKEAAQRLPLLLVHVQGDQPPIKKVALQGIFDVLMVFGINALTGGDGTEPTGDAASCSVESVLNTLVSFIDDSDSELQTVAVEGISRLMFSGRLTETSLVSRLLILYFNPATEELEKLRQCLAVFFPAYAFSSTQNQRIIAEIFTNCIRTLMKAPRSSPLSQVLPLKVAQFMVYLTDPRSLMANTEVVLGQTSAHGTIAQAVVSEVLNGDSADAKIYGRVLTLLHADASDQATVRLIRSAISQVNGCIGDKATCKALDKRSEELKALDHQPEAELVAVVGSPSASSVFSSPGKAAKRKLHKNNKAVITLESDEDGDEQDEALKPAANTAVNVPDDVESDEEAEEEDKTVTEAMDELTVEQEAEEAPEEEVKEEVKEEEEKEEVPEVTVTKSQLNKMKVAELREELEQRGADTKGTKPILLNRLWNVLHGLPEDAPEEPVSTKKKSSRR